MTVTTDQTTAGGICGFSRQVLDSVGIRVDLKTLPSASLYVLACDAKFGRGRLGRFWAQRVRPWLRPVRQHLVDEAYAVALLQRRQEFMSAVLMGMGNDT